MKAPFSSKASRTSKNLDIDVEITSSLSRDFEAARAVRKRAALWVKRCLGLSTNVETILTTSNQIIIFFKVLGDAVNKAYDHGDDIANGCSKTRL
ncbi:Terpene synthase metal-binding domain [Fusarium albosuccineum]|uniref:Terpene synthase metal-binding domain n=1 Tax=Fusarium albosuccineum TaxID=1237068 RepID=A0A8H4P7S4_9HYPO|nr:Terpene synthase metal-binding domain [Fusarium albosuccineum]